MLRLEEEPWYRAWHDALHRAVAAHMTLARTVESPERELAQKEYDEALAAYHVLAPMVSSMVQAAGKARGI
jgi:hypothetical protein